MVKIKAINLRSSKEFIKEKFGEDALRKVIDSLSEEDRNIVNTVLPSSWIPQDTWIRFFEAVVRELAAGDESIVKEAGSYTANKELSSIHRLFLKFGNPENIAKKVPVLMETYFSADEHDMEATATKLGENKYRISAKKFEPRQRLVEIAILGWLENAFKLSGAKNLSIRITKSLNEGEGSIEYLVSWQ
jgi:hypothetical protein